MVQIPLRKVGFLAGLLAFVLLAGAFLAALTDVGCHEHDANAGSPPNSASAKELRRSSPPGNVLTLKSEQKAELKGIYADIVQAYSNGQVEVLRDFRRGLPEKVEFIGRDDLIEVGRLFLDVLHVELFEKVNKILAKEPIGEKFHCVGEFEKHVASFLEIVRLYGDIQVRRRARGGLFEHLEAYVFLRLKSYRDGFRAEGRPDMEQAAGRFLAEWIKHIESENGYTRASVIAGIAWARQRGDELMKEPSRTWEDVSQGVVRGRLHMLTLFGYTPKWLDEFSNIPRHAIPNAKPPMKGDAVNSIRTPLY